MPRRGQSDEPIVPEPEVPERPQRADVDAAFDTARSLLSDALEVVRATGSPRPESPAPESEDHWPPIAETPDRHDAAKRRRRRERNAVAPLPSVEDPQPARPRRPRRSPRAGDDAAIDEIIDTLRLPEPERPPEPRVTATPAVAAAASAAPVIDEVVETEEAPAVSSVVEDAPPSVAEPAGPVVVEDAPPRVAEPAGPVVVEDAPPRVEEPAGPVVGEDAPPRVADPAGDATPPIETEGPRSRRRTRVALVGVLAVAVIGVGALVGVFGGGASDGTPAGVVVTQSARFVFDPVTTSEGVTVQRVWRLRGKDGAQFVGTISFSNPTSAPIDVQHTEVFPKSLASSVDDIAFDIDPVVLQADPVVQYSVTVPAGEEVTARYTIRVAPDGARRARLAVWAQDLETTTPDVTTSSTTTTTTAVGPPVTAPIGTGTPTPPKTASPPPPPRPATGTIAIRMVSRNGTGTFGFSGPGGGVAITTSGAPDGTGQSASMTVPVGRYSWTQVSRPPGFGGPSIDCTDRDAGPFQNRSTVSGSTATFNVQAGETVVCTWTNST